MISVLVILLMERKPIKKISGRYLNIIGEFVQFEAVFLNTQKCAKKVIRAFQENKWIVD
jgi:hypothetical protein